jgi:hypothetical protein
VTESVEAGRRVRLPAGAERPIQVFINGTEQSEGADYAVRGRDILFTRALLREQVSGVRWLAMFLGLFGSYGKHDTVDLHFRLRGETRVLTDAEVLD